MQKKTLEELRRVIEANLQKLFSVETTAPPLYKMASYLLFAPAKRIRPLFTLIVADLFGINPFEAVQPASALEILHTYSLIHDDLPCMDDDALRRGQPSMHTKYGEAEALLVGDFLLTYAFEVITEAPHQSASQKIELLKILSKQGGSEGMIGGQWLELQPPDPTSPKEELTEAIYLRKTGALFVAAFQMGAIIAQVPLPTLVLLTMLGQKVGYLFQLIDDLEDGDYPHSKEKALGEIRNLKQEIEELMGRLPSAPLLAGAIASITHSVQHQ